MLAPPTPGGRNNTARAQQAAPSIARWRQRLSHAKPVNVAFTLHSADHGQVESKDATTVDLAEHEASLAEADPPPQLTLLVYSRAGVQAFALGEGRWTIGRSRPAEIRVKDPSLSRQHALLEVSVDEVKLADLGSTNGTRVNGRKLRKARALSFGDQLKLGSVHATLHGAATQGGRRPIESHDALLTALESEVRRSKLFDRPTALVMLRPAKAERPLDSWCRLLQDQVRSVDRIGLYDMSTLLLMLPESDAEQARSFVCAVRERAKSSLLAGIATQPENGSSAQALISAVSQALAAAKPRSPIALAPSLARPQRPALLAPLVAESSAMRSALDTVSRVATSPLPVLLSGETGVGKEVVALQLHKQSRRSGPLQSINCGAIAPDLAPSLLFGHRRGAFTGAVTENEGLFQSAHNGTIFLDEIGELPLGIQASLLRVLETKSVRPVGGDHEQAIDVRVIAATHRDLREMVEQGEFRRDLLFRLNAIEVQLPALRERREDIVPLTRRFIAEVAKRGGRRIKEIEDSAVSLLRSYTWPGNIRELRNEIERAILIGDGPVLRVDDLSARIRQAPDGAHAEGSDLKGRLQSYEAQILVEALDECGGNQTAAAKALGMPLRTFVRKLKKYGLQKRV